MATLQAAIDEIQAQVATVSGIRAAPDEPPEAINAFPFAVCYASSGRYSIGPPDVMHGMHSIILEVHVARVDLARDVGRAMGYAKSIPNRVFYALKAGTLPALETIGAIRYEFGAMMYAGQKTLGFRFTLENVKTDDLITA